MMKNETKKQTFDRSAGVLMSISSLPSDYGIGTMGKAAYEFADFVRACNHKYWQVLPIGSTTYGDSPYQSYSAFAGNPYFIDLDMLAEDGLLLKSDMLQLTGVTEKFRCIFQRKKPETETLRRIPISDWVMSVMSAMKKCIRTVLRYCEKHLKAIKRYAVKAR